MSEIRRTTKREPISEETGRLIFQLLEEGKSQREISAIVRYGRSTVCEYIKSARDEEYKRRICKRKKSGDTVLGSKIDSFKRITDKNKDAGHVNFGEKEFKDFCTDPVDNYLGISIDLDSEQVIPYSLDHEISRSSGGSNTKENANVLTRQMNMIKGDRSPKETMTFCYRVVIYDILKKLMRVTFLDKLVKPHSVINYIHPQLLKYLDQEQRKFAIEKEIEELALKQKQRLELFESKKNHGEQEEI